MPGIPHRDLSDKAENSSPLHAQSNGNAPEHTRAKGASAEELAVAYLTGLGYTVESRNYRVRIGEIDCIVRDKDGTLVFVEVKSSRTETCGHPFSWVTRGKQQTLAKVAKWYLAEQRLKSCACRFDVIAVKNGHIDHLKNAFLV